MTMGDHEHGYFIFVDPLTCKNENAASYANSSVCAGVVVKCKATSSCRRCVGRRPLPASAEKTELWAGIMEFP